MIREVDLNLWSRNDGEDDTQWTLTAYAHENGATNTDAYISVSVPYEIVEKHSHGYDSWYAEGDESFLPLFHTLILGLLDGKEVKNV